MDKRPIGVFDSGLGGLTAVRELRRILPGEDLVYFGDTGRIPYGTRGQATILQYARQDIRFLLGQGVKCIMAACGTVSSIYPAAEAGALPVPYLGVVDTAARAAACATQNGRVGVIGTPATIKSGSYQRALAQLLPHAAVTARACPMFVPLVENGYVAPGDPVALAIAHEYLDEVRGAGVDTLILGCTHYPLLAPAIAQVMGPGVRLVDPGREAAHTLLALLQGRGLLNGGGGQARYYVSDSTEGFAQAAGLFLGRYAGGAVEQIPIETY